jgi:hypothetical protein
VEPGVSCLQWAIHGFCYFLHRKLLDLVENKDFSLFGTKGIKEGL